MNFKHFIALNVADVITTYIALSYMGLNELNPLYVSAFGKIGLLPGLIVIKLFGLVIIYILYKLIPDKKITQLYNINAKKISIAILCSMYFFILLNNTYHNIRLL